MTKPKINSPQLNTDWMNALTYVFPNRSAAAHVLLLTDSDKDHKHRVTDWPHIQWYVFPIPFKQPES